MIKICYVVTIPLTIEAFFIPQLKYLAINGFDVTVVCSKSKKLQSELGNKVRFVPIEIPRGISTRGSIITIKKLIKFFREEKFDLVQYSTPNAALYASIAAKKAGVKVRNYHLMGFRYLGATGIGKVILKEIEKITCRNSTSIECVSKSNLKLGIKNRIFPSKKATVVWNGSTGGVDLERFNIIFRNKYRNEIRKKYNINSDTFVYGFVGRITRDKGINEILEAFFEIEDSSVLMLIGNPEATNTLNQELYLKSLSSSRIVYTGNVTEVEKYFCAIDVLLLPSYREGFGNVVIEAASMGTPAIVSNIPGPIDTIDKNKTALVIPAKNSKALLKAMKKIKYMDYSLMGKNASVFVKRKFDSKILCHKILQRKKYLLKGKNIV